MNQRVWGAILVLISLNCVMGYSVLQVSKTNTEMNPGETGVITLSLTNAGNDVAYNTRIVLKALDSPLTSDSTCNNCKEHSSTQRVCLEFRDYCYTQVGDIYGSNGQDASFRINVPEDIESGVYIAEFVIHYTSKNITSNVEINRQLTKRYALEVDNPNIKPEVSIKSIDSPEIISPGDEFNITVTLENTGEVEAEELIINLLSDDLEVKGTTNSRTINNLEVNEITIINYTLLADAALIPGVYGIDFALNYSDNDNSYSKTSSTGLLINGQADFNLFIQDISPDIITSDSEVTAFISVANIGVIDARSVSVQINPCSDIEVGMINEDFLGDLDAGDFTSTSFTFKPKKEGESRIELTVKYTTPSGEKIALNSTERIVFSFSDQKTTTMPRGYGLINITIIVIGIIITYFVIKRLLKKKK